jgi:hypothetical protein
MDDYPALLQSAPNSQQRAIRPIAASPIDACDYKLSPGKNAA